MNLSTQKLFQEKKQFFCEIRSYYNRIFVRKRLLLSYTLLKYEDDENNKEG